MTLATTNRSWQVKCHGVDKGLDSEEEYGAGGYRGRVKSDRQEEGGRKEEKFEKLGKGKGL
jgi:hypothetical protein